MKLANLHTRRLTALLLALVFLLQLMPMHSYAASSQTRTITIVDENGDPVTNATVTVKRSSSTTTYTVTNQGDGTYTFTGANSSWYSYTITVEADGYEAEDSYTMSRNTTSMTITLQSTALKYAVTVNVQDSQTGEAISGASVTLDSSTAETSNGTCTFNVVNGTYDIAVTADSYNAGNATVTVADSDTEVTVLLDLTPEYISFEIFYIASGELPDTYAGTGDAANYGPSGNDVPLVLLDVNISELKREKYSDVVSFVENTNGNQWHFIPTGENGDKEAAAAFWAAVLECSTEESIATFEETGLLDQFIGYCLKAQGSGNDYHGDGILNVTPPVYVIELYREHTYVGGSVTDENTPFKTIAEVLASLEGYLGHNITWNEDADGNPIAVDNVYSGTYIADNTLYTIEVEQTNLDAAQEIEGSAIPYEKKSDQYYLALFDISETGTPLQIEYTVTYKDGLNASLFHDHEYGVDDGEAVPAFTGNPSRTSYCFIGWTVEGGDGTVYIGEEITQMTVTADMVFVAVYEPITVTFHTNNTDSSSADIFRTYSPADSGSEYCLNAAGSIDSFYDIPAFTYETHNSYIFKGWYLDPDSESNPMDWNAVYTEDTDIYAHWIAVEDVAQEEADGKQNIPDGTYRGFDLAGTQIRYSETDPDDHHDYSGTGAGSGLRFITVLSEAVWSEIQAANTQNSSSAEYGVVLAKTNTAKNNNEASDSSYQLQYVGSNVNGQDTTEEYWYARNLKCNGVKDHYNGTGYRLYTAVVTYKNYADEAALNNAYAVAFLVRSYIRYYDVNGLYRTYYNNYTEETAVYHGCSASYSQVLTLTQEVTQ